MLFTCNSAFCQKKVRGIIKNAINNEILSFASVQFILSKDGKYADEHGYFELSSNFKNDTLVINYLSFNEKKIPINSLSDDINEIELTNKTIELPTVVVKGQKSSKKVIIGHFDFPTKFTWGTGTGLIFMNYYKNQFQHRKIITKLYFDFGSILKEKNKSVVRVRIKRNDSNDGLPGSDLIEENLLATINRFSSKLIFDVEKYNIDLPKEGIYIGLEMIGVYKGGELNTDRLGKNTVNITSTTDTERSKIGSAWRFSTFERKWYTVNFKKGNDTMFKFGFELKDPN